VTSGGCGAAARSPFPFAVLAPRPSPVVNTAGVVRLEIVKNPTKCSGPNGAAPKKN
jgi:hypothetical protein